jgi:Ricin-type beta-trefoil lectin domain
MPAASRAPSTCTDRFPASCDVDVPAIGVLGHTASSTATAPGSPPLSHLKRQQLDGYVNSWPSGATGKPSRLGVATPERQPRELLLGRPHCRTIDARSRPTVGKIESGGTMKRLLLASVMVAATLVVAAGTGQAQALSGYHPIVNHYTLCLDAENDANNQPNNDGDKVQLWSCAGSSQQQWRLIQVATNSGKAIYEIRNAYDTNMCLDQKNDSAGNPGNNGDKIQMWYCSGAMNQLWWILDGDRFVSYYASIVTGESMCLDAERDAVNNPTNNGDKVQLWQCTSGNLNQTWSFTLQTLG